MYRSFNSRGSGATVILENNIGLAVEVSLRIEFLTTNNQVEYETVIVGMFPAKGMGADHIELRIDSQLVVS